MKKLSTLVAAVMLASIGFGQYYYTPSTTPGNPGGLNGDDEFPGPTAGWVSILPGSQATPAWSSTETIPFAFNFNGNAVTQYKASSSGVVTFSVGASAVPGHTNSAIPNASIPDNSIMIWGIEGTGSSDVIATKTFGSSPNRQHWVSYTSYTAGSWTYWSVVFEETTDNIFIVDQRHSSAATVAVTAGIQIDGATAVSVAGSPSLGNLAGSNASPSDNWYYEFVYGTQSDYDFTGVDITTDEYLILSQAPFTIEGNFANFGSQTITSYDINYRINGGTPVTVASGATSVAPYATEAFSSSSAWTPTATGSYLVEAWASNLNGNADQNTANDITSMTVIVVDTFTQRLPFYETYTSSTCGPCVSANANLKTLFNANPGKFSSVKFQMSWPGNGDPYYTDEAGNRRNWYGITSVPRVEIDGGFDQNGNNVTQQIMDDYWAIPSFIELDATFLVNSSGQSVDVDVDINPLVNISNNNMVLHIAIIENETYNNVGTNGEVEFLHVMKKMLPDEDGTNLPSFTAFNSLNYTENYTFNGSYVLPPDANSPINHATEHSIEDWNNLSVVVWVQDMSTKEVLQSAYAVIDPASGITENENELAGTLYPNPTNDITNILFSLDEISDVQMTVYNMLGAVVMTKNMGTLSEGQQQLTFDASTMENGFYTVIVQAGDRTMTRKMIVD
jgi:hypothetical protein